MTVYSTFTSDWGVALTVRKAGALCDVHQIGRGTEIDQMADANYISRSLALRIATTRPGIKAGVNLESDNRRPYRIPQ